MLVHLVNKYGISLYYIEKGTYTGPALEHAYNLLAVIYGASPLPSAPGLILVMELLPPELWQNAPSWGDRYVPSHPPNVYTTHLNDIYESGRTSFG